MCTFPYAYATVCTTDPRSLNYRIHMLLSMTVHAMLACVCVCALTHIRITRVDAYTCVSAGSLSWWHAAQSAVNQGLPGNPPGKQGTRVKYEPAAQ